MEKANQFEEFTREVNRLAATPYKEVSASFLLSALASIVQYQTFPPMFLAFTTLCGGIAGTAALLSVYLSASRNPAALFSSFQPSKVSRKVLIHFAGTLLSLGLFYQLVTAGTVWCLAPAVVASFLLFRGVALSAITLRLMARFGELTQEQQNALVKEVEQRRIEATKQRRDIQQLLDEMAKDTAEREARIEELWEDTRQMLKQQEQEARRAKVLHLLTLPLRLTRRLRGRVGLLTVAEKINQVREKRIVDQLFYGDGVKAVLEGRGKRVRYEAIELELYEADHLLYIVVQGAWDFNRVQSLLKDLKTVKRQVNLIIRSDADLTVEAAAALRESGMALHEAEFA